MEHYSCQITHDGLLPRTPEQGGQKVLVYVFTAKNDIDAKRKANSLGTQFQGKNFRLLNCEKLKAGPEPKLVGILTL